MFITDSIESKIMTEIDSISRMNKIKSINLGGITGASGGQGAPPGGFIGQLAQKYVTYDTEELSTSASGTTLVNNLNRIRGGYAIADEAIIQRHIASGVGTLAVGNLTTIYPNVARLNFKNTVITETSPTDLILEIFPPESTITMSGYEAFKWHADGYLSSGVSGFNGIYYTNTALTTSQLLCYVESYGNGKSEFDIETSTDGVNWTSIFTNPFPSLSSGQYYSLTNINSTINANTFIRSKLRTVDNYAKNLSLILFTEEDISASLVSEIPDKTGQSGKFLSTDGNILQWQTPVGQVSSVFGRTGAVISEYGDYTHGDLISGGTYTHDEIDTHLSTSYLHLPFPSGLVGAFLVNDGTQPYWIYPSGFGHIILLSGIPVTIRPNLSFAGNVQITDDEIENSTLITVTNPSSSTDFASVVESNAGTLTNKAVTPQGLPLRVESDALINNQPYGGNARGTGAIDFQSNRAANTQVASGNQSAIFAGENNTASTDNATVINGQDNTASGTQSTVINGLNNIASGDMSIAMGKYAVASNFGQIVQGADTFGTSDGDAQGTIQIITKGTNDFSSVSGWIDTLLPNSQLITIPDDRLWTIDILIAISSFSGDCASYHISSAIKNVGGTVTILAENKTVIYEDIAAWDIQLVVSGSTFTVQFIDTTDTDTLYCVATYRTSEVTL